MQTRMLRDGRPAACSRCCASTSAMIDSDLPTPTDNGHATREGVRLSAVYR
jgi:hypothetical protein